MESAGSSHKDMALEVMRLMGQGRFKDTLRYFAPGCKTHNPYIAGDMEALTDAMIEANREGKASFPDAEFTIAHAIAEGDLVAIHTQLLNSKHDIGQGGLRQVHLFRFEGDNIAEYWDVTQLITPEQPNAGGSF